MKLSEGERNEGMMKTMMLMTQKSPWVCGKSLRRRSIKLENGVLYKILKLFLVTFYALILCSICVEDIILL